MIVKHDDENLWAAKCDVCGRFEGSWCDSPEEAEWFAWASGFIGIAKGDGPDDKLDICPECWEGVTP